LLARILLASLFIISGLGIVLGGAPAFEGFEGMVASTGVVPAALLGVVTVCIVALKVFGGLALAAGFKSRYVALALAFFTLLTIVFIHKPSLWADQIQFLMAMKNLSIIGGLLLVANNGSGAMSYRCSPHCKLCA
jgi:putative oxidoreductase